MGNLVVLVIVVLVAIVAIGLLTSRQGSNKQGATSFPYRKQRALFSPAERSFLGVLDREVEGRYRVFGKVRLADVLAVASGTDASQRATAFNRISKKHVDFVLCSPTDLSIAAVIELDDSSHKRADRQERDGFLDAACRAAGLRLIRFPVKSAYSSSDLREALAGIEPLSLEEQRSTLVEK